MRNEILLILSVFIIYSLVIFSYCIFKKTGLYVMTAVVAILANIEVLIIIDAFGLRQTLGNVMFASTYLITDILSENEGKKSASLSVWIGVFVSALMFLFTQYWLLFKPCEADWVSRHIKAIFSTTPRLILASFVGYIISQCLDVWLYHYLWEFTTKKTGSKQRFLWLRNNLSTLISQLVNTVVFTIVAFLGWYDNKTLISIMMSSYIVFIFTSLLDTPVVYLSRLINKKSKIFIN
ncbi:MAG: queuosine precursor transporter [Oscillospiraceae bacterium]|nr:queuosine precursor transporter [Oscillospiraceae bacterium]